MKRNIKSDGYKNTVGKLSFLLLLTLEQKLANYGPHANPPLQLYSQSRSEKLDVML